MGRLLCAFSFLVLSSVVSDASAHIFRISDASYVTFNELVRDLGTVRLVFIGELHDNEGHHGAQIQVIRALRRSGRAVAIGLEMFRRESQSALDLWVDGEMPEKEFVAIYDQNWGLKWNLYKEIFEYARQERMPLWGLNIPRDITRKVATNGRGALSPEEQGELPGIRCDVDIRYQDYMRDVIGGHGNNMPNFLHFCEAQVLWDTIMANALLDFASKYPDHIIVVLAGSGHTWKHGIPEQIKRRSDIPLRVLQPEIAGKITRSNMSTKEADYLLIGLDEAPLH